VRATCHFKNRVRRGRFIASNYWAGGVVQPNGGGFDPTGGLEGGGASIPGALSNCFSEKVLQLLQGPYQLGVPILGNPARNLASCSGVVTLYRNIVPPCVLSCRVDDATLQLYISFRFPLRQSALVNLLCSVRTFGPSDLRSHLLRGGRRTVFINQF
jgi:hypothetical protein